jgi:hypothetical protein
VNNLAVVVDFREELTGLSETMIEAAANLDIEDPWLAMFDAASAGRDEDASELVPYWIYPVEGGAQIQRFVPSLPLSQELDRLAAMRNALAVYRMVFGQPRQDDLLEYLLKRMPKEKLTEELKELRIDLTPPVTQEVSKWMANET